MAGFTGSHFGSQCELFHPVKLRIAQSFFAQFILLKIRCISYGVRTEKLTSNVRTVLRTNLHINSNSPGDSFARLHGVASQSRIIRHCLGCLMGHSMGRSHTPNTYRKRYPMGFCMGRLMGRSSITEVVIVPIPQWWLGSGQTVENTLETMRPNTCPYTRHCVAYLVYFAGGYTRP